MLSYKYTPMYVSSNGTLTAQGGKSFNMIPIKADNIDNLRRNLMDKHIHADRIIIRRKSGSAIGYMCFKGKKVYWTAVTRGKASDRHRIINDDGTLGSYV